MFLLLVANGYLGSKRVRLADALQMLQFSLQIAQLHLTLMLLIQQILHESEHTIDTSFESGIEAASIILTHSC